MIAMAQTPRPDEHAIDSFCELVFGYLEGFAPVRRLAEKGTPGQRPKSTFTQAGEISTALKRMAGPAAANAQGLFVVPCTVERPGSAKAADIAQTGVVLIDLDTGDIPAKLAHLVQHLGAPSMEVASGGRTAAGQDKLHLYWRLTEAVRGTDLQRVKDVRSEIARKAGGDPALGSLHLPIRVAGTLHGKYGRLAAVRLIAHRSCEYELTDLAEAVDAMPAFCAIGPAADVGTERPAGPAPRDLTRLKVREGGVDGITRFDALSRVIGHWLRNARRGECKLGEAWSAVLDHNAAMIDPPWEEDRLRGEFERLHRLDIKNHGPVRENGEGDPTAPGLGVNAAPDLSEDALAAAFVAAEGVDWRHVPAWHSWFRWNERVWVRDETGLVRERMRLICRRAADGAGAAVARRIASERTISAALKLAGTDPRIAMPTGAWDAHPMLLNTGSGILDLATGELAPHDRTRLLTQMTAASVGTDCPRWRTFLDEITDGDEALQGYLQRLAGYCLTGRTSEQAFAFLHGEGANGKSVFLGTLAQVLGSYAATATLDTFSASRTSRHLTELAGLRAARLVLVPETESGQACAEARIKMVTGGENIRANFMRQDHFEFRPQFTLIVAGNHRPSLTSIGEAMRRRLHLVPFTVTIPPERRDPRLVDKLRAERDGILGWMLEGCAAWQEKGLAPPERVLAAAEDYFASEDVLGQWLDECCSRAKNAKEPSAMLFQSWRNWAEARGLPAGTLKSFGEMLRARGFTSGKVNRARGWYGLTIDRAARHNLDKGEEA